MLRNLIILCLATFSLSVLSANDYGGPASVRFHNGDFNSALKSASTDGKLLIVDFYADWCQPCKWMEKTTFKDTDVVSMLNENFVVYKANIDTKDGFITKEKYGIQFLPTLLIFNTKGELVERLESTQTAENLLPVLQFHNHPNNKLKITHQFNSSPQQADEKSSEDFDVKLLYEEYKATEKVKTSYRLQVGVFEEYNAAFEQVNSLREEFLEPIVVLNDFKNGKTLYKVMMGEFQTANEAESFRIILQNTFNIPSIVN